MKPISRYSTEATNSWAISFLESLTAPDPERLRRWLTSHDLDEDRVRWLSGQRLAPYVYYRLKVTKLLTHLRLPACQSALAAAYYATAVRNTMLVTELSEFLTDLAALDVEPIVLKGMALGTTVYPALPTRPMSDVDLWIRRSQVEKITGAFTARRYADMGLAPEAELAISAHLRRWREYSGNQQVVVEAHWSLFYDSDLREMDSQSIRSRACRIDLEGQSVLVLDSFDRLIHACAHLALRHSESWNLLWLLDLRLLTDRYGSIWNWRAMVDRAVDLHLAGIVRYWLDVTEIWFGVFLPEQAREALAGIEPSADQIDSIEMTQSKQMRIWQVVQKRARGASRIQQILMYWRFLFPPWTYIQYRYRARSIWLAPVYYGWRLIRGAAVAFRKK